MGERLPCKQEVTSSNLVISIQFERTECTLKTAYKKFMIFKFCQRQRKLETSFSLTLILLTQNISDKSLYKSKLLKVFTVNEPPTKFKTKNIKTSEVIVITKG